MDAELDDEHDITPPATFALDERGIGDFILHNQALVPFICVTIVATWTLLAPALNNTAAEVHFASSDVTFPLRYQRHTWVDSMLQSRWAVYSIIISIPVATIVMMVWFATSMYQMCCDAHAYIDGGTIVSTDGVAKLVAAAPASAPVRESKTRKDTALPKSSSSHFCGSIHCDDYQRSLMRSM
jgi:hypothetical protein